MNQFDERLGQLRARFAARARQDAAEIERLVAGGDWGAVRDLAHGLAGIAGMFGYGPLGELAREVEEGVDAGDKPADGAKALANRLRALDQER